MAQNGLQETFQYNPGTCTTKRGFIICAPHQVRIHTNPTTCEETMLSPDTADWNICTNSLQISKVTTQSTIFLQTLSKIRIFSPYKDNISTLCGGNFTKNLTTIMPGYTDMKASSACVRWVMGGEGRGQWRTVKSSRVGGAQPMSAQIALFPTNGRPVVRMV